MIVKKVFLCCGFVVLALSLLVIQAGHAQEEPEFIVSQPLEKRIIVEEIHSFTEQYYDPPAEIHLISSQNEAFYDSPEDTLIAVLSAGVKGDIEWELSVRDKVLRKEFENLDVKTQLKKMKAIKRQSEFFFKDRRLVLNRRIAVGDSMVIIEFTTYGREDGKRIMRLPFSFILEQGRWKVSGAAENPEHPLYHLLLNLNYDFSGKEKRLSESAVYTVKPDIPSSNLNKEESKKENAQ